MEFTGLLCYPDFQSAMPLLRDKTKLIETVEKSPGGVLEMLIGGMPFRIDMTAALAAERLNLEQLFSR